MTQEDLIGRIQQLEGLQHAVLNGIIIDTHARECVFEIITDRAYSREEENEAALLVRQAVPDSLKATVRIRKLVADPQLICHKILEYLSRNHRAAAACIHSEDIEIKMGETIEFCFGVDAAERGFFEKNEQLIPGIVKMLERNFCNRFAGGLYNKEKGGIPEELDENEELETFDYRPARTFPIANFETIDEANVPKIATYISDCDFASEMLTICGEIIFLQDRTTKPKTDATGATVKEGRPYLRFTIEDATGRMSFSYFPKKKTEENIPSGIGKQRAVPLEDVMAQVVDAVMEEEETRRQVAQPVVRRGLFSRKLRRYEDTEPVSVPEEAEREEAS